MTTVRKTNAAVVAEINSTSRRNTELCRLDDNVSVGIVHNLFTVFEGDKMIGVARKPTKYEQMMLDKIETLRARLAIARRHLEEPEAITETQ